MRAVVYKEPFKVAVEEVEDPRIEDPTDVVVEITTTAICGSDLHMYEGRTDAERASCSVTRTWARSWTSAPEWPA